MKSGRRRGQKDHGLAYKEHGLAYVAVDRGHTYAEGGRQPGAGVTAAQVGQDEQGLPIRGQAPPRVPTCRRRSASCLVRKRTCEPDRSIADG